MFRLCMPFAGDGDGGTQEVHTAPATSRGNSGGKDDVGGNGSASNRMRDTSLQRINEIEDRGERRHQVS